MENTYQLVGYAAGIVSSVGFLPQTVKAFRTKKVRDVAVWQPVLLLLGMILWLIYGVILKDLPIIAANTFAIACNGALVVMKFAYAKNG